MRSKILVFLLLSLLLVSFNLNAQIAGRLTGTVVEKGSENGLIGANVMIEGTQYGSATDAQGQFLIGNVPPGTYTVVVHYIGYQTEKQEVQVQASQVTSTNFEEGVKKEIDWIRNNLNLWNCNPRV